MTSDLSFRSLYRVKSILGDMSLKNVVGIFTGDGEPLLVHTSPFSNEYDPRLRAIHVSELPHYNLEKYQSDLVFGFAALGLIRDDIMTQGPGFFPLHKLFQERGQIDDLRYTLFQLAHFLEGLWKRSHAERPPEWGVQLTSKIIKYALPTFLETWPVQNLVAIIPSDRMINFLERSATLVYAGALPPDAADLDVMLLEDLPALPPYLWIVALEEVARFDSRLDPGAQTFIELRDLLRGKCTKSSYRQTLGRLAQGFYRQFQKTEDGEALRVAYSLACEHWLSDAEVDDLVAVLPDEKFMPFLASGRSRYYYRKLPESLSARDAGLDHWSRVHHHPVDELAGHLEAARASAPRVATFCPPHAGESPDRWLSLGGILLKSGRARTLGRTCLIYSRDLATQANGAGNHPGSLKDAVDLATRACLTYGLLNPWDWPEGRFKLLVRRAYENLNELLAKLIDTLIGPSVYFYQMRRAFYLCATVDAGQIEHQIRDWVSLGQAFLESRAEEPDQEVPQEWCDEAERCVLAGEAMLDVLAGGGFTRRFEQALGAADYEPGHLTARGLLRSVYPTLNLPNPSGLFYHCVRRLHKILEPEQRALWREWDVGERIRISELEARELEVAGRLVFALPHETAVLKFLHGRVLGDVRERIGKLRTSAELHCELLTETVTHKQAVQIRFRLKNIGLVTAQDVEVKMAPSPSFRLGDESPVKRIDDLGPNQSRDIIYTITPQDEQTLRLGLTFQGRTDEERHTYQKEFRLRVQPPRKSKPFTRKKNPYIYGPPITQSSYFYGHQAELQNLIDILHVGGKQNVIVRGPRRTGKTSLLFMLRFILRDEGGARARFRVDNEQSRLLDHMHPLYLDLQETLTIVSAVGQRFSESLPAAGGAGKRVTAEMFFVSLLYKFRECLRWSEAEAEAMIAYYRSKSDYSVNVQIKSTLTHIAAGLPPGHRVVILLDEFDVVYENEEFFGLLRSIIQEMEWITWVISSTGGVYRDIDALRSPFFNNFKFISLSGLKEPDALRLIREPIAHSDLAFDEEAPRLIYELTQGHPYFLQLLCHEMIEEVNEQRFNEVRSDLIPKVVERAIAPNRATEFHFRYLWDTVTGLEQLILAVLSRQRSPVFFEELRQQVEQELAALPADSRRRVSAEFGESIRELVEIVGAVEKNYQGKYFFSMPLFARWFWEQDKRAAQTRQPLAARAVEKLLGEEGKV